MEWVDCVATEVCACTLCPYMEVAMVAPCALIWRFPWLCLVSPELLYVYVFMPVQYTEDVSPSYRLGMRQCVWTCFPYLHQDHNQQPYIHITEATLQAM